MTIFRAFHNSLIVKILVLHLALIWPWVGILFLFLGVVRYFCSNIELPFMDVFWA
jgi:hypothetical protein